MVESMEIEKRQCGCGPEARLEGVVLSEVEAAGGLSQRDVLTAWTELNISALDYLVHDPQHPCFSANPPRWCLYAGAQRRNSLDFFVQGVADRGLLDCRSALAVQNPISGMAGAVLRRALEERKLKPETAFDVLEAVSTIGRQGQYLEGSWLAQFCSENPGSPVCLLANRGRVGRGVLVQEEIANLAFVHLAQEHDLIGIEDARAVLASTHAELAAAKPMRDISVSEAQVIMKVAGLNPKEVSKVRTGLLDLQGLYGPDSPWADICRQAPPPPFCTRIHEIPIALNLISELASRKLLNLERTMAAVGVIIVIG